MSGAFDALRESAESSVARGNFKKALFDYKMLVQMQPGEPQHKVAAAEVCVKLGELSQAVNLWRAAIEQFAEKGESLKAVEIAQIVLRNDPADEWTRNFVAAMYSKSKHHSVELQHQKPVEITVDHIEPARTGDLVSPESYDDVDIDFDDEPPGVEEAAKPRVLSPDELPRIPLLSELSKNAFLDLLTRMEKRAYRGGEALMRDGEEGTSMFIMISGSAEVSISRHGKRVDLGVLKPGDFFGEMGMILSHRRNADVVAREDCSAFEISEQVMRELMASYPSVAQVVSRFYQQRLLVNVARVSPVLSVLDPKARQGIISRCKTVREPSGKVLVEAGESLGNFYFLAQGDAEIRRNGQKVARLGVGDCFGEIPSHEGMPSPIDVVMLNNCVLLRATVRQLKEWSELLPAFGAAIEAAVLPFM